MPRFSDLKARAIAKATSLSQGQSSPRDTSIESRREAIVDSAQTSPAVTVERKPRLQSDITTTEGGPGDGLENSASSVALLKKNEDDDVNLQSAPQAPIHGSLVASRSGGPAAPDLISVTLQSDTSSINEQCRSWIEALKQLKQDNPQAYAQLEGMRLDKDKLTNMTSQRIEEYESKTKSANSSQWFGRLKRLLPAIGSVKGLAMAVSRVDPHQIAPYICASVFCAFELALNVVNPDDVLLILEVVSESTIVLQKWLLFEPYASNYSNPATQSRIGELFEELPRLYGYILRLLLSIDSHLNGLRLKKAIDRISQIDVQWKTMFEEVKRSNKKCDAIRSQAEFLSVAQKDSEAVLNWISTRPIEESHSQIMEKTGVSNKYSERGAWFFNSTGFRSWQQGIDENPTERVLWLKGSPGTGKTTLICRVIETLMLDQSFGSSYLARICHFYCSAGTGSTSPSCETIIRALLRQLAFLPNFTVSTEAVATYRRHEQTQSQKTALSSGDWKHLFENVASSTKSQGLCIICIDALDECEPGQTDDLLQMLGILVAKHSHIFLMITSQMHVKIPIYFAENLLTVIQIESWSVQHDIAYYVDTEIRARAALPREKNCGILSAEANEDLRERFRTALVLGAQGMFQWVKIWLAVMFPVEPIAHLSEAEDLLKALEGQQPLNGTLKDSWKSLNEAYYNLYTRVRHRPADRKYKIRAYRVILSAYKPLTPAEVAEAVSVENDETLTASVTETYVRELCHNFFVESSEGLKITHESAKLFLRDMMKNANGERSQLDDYSTPTSQAELARLCIRVMARIDHPIWTSKSLCPEEWARTFSDAAQIQKWSRFVRKWRVSDSHRDQLDSEFSSHGSRESFSGLLDWSQVNLLCGRPFALYIILHWHDHWQDAVFAINYGTLNTDELPVASFVAALEDFSRSAIPACVLLMHAYSHIFPSIANLLPFNREHDFNTRWLRDIPQQSRILRCILQKIDGALMVNTSIMAITLNVIPRVYMHKYFNSLGSSSEIRESELNYLWTFLDKATANLDLRNFLGDPLLITAIKNGSGTDVVDSVLRFERSRCQRMFVNRRLWTSSLLLARDTWGNTALHLAAKSPEMVRMLLDFEADQMGCHFPDTTKREWNPSGWLSRHACIVNRSLEAPLHQAARAGNSEVVSMLIQAGAAEMLVEDINGVQIETPIINAQNISGSTPLQLNARQSNSSLVTKHLLRLPNIEINLSDTSGNTPLHTIARRLPFAEKVGMVSLLLDDDRIKPDLANKKGETPLQLAVKVGDEKTVRMLCGRPDIRPDARNENGETALWIAKYKRLKAHKNDVARHEEIIRVLLTTGRVNTDPLDNQGQSPDARLKRDQQEERRR